VAGSRLENNLRAARHNGVLRVFSGVLSGREVLRARFPDTMWLANFRCSFGAKKGKNFARVFFGNTNRADNFEKMSHHVKNSLIMNKC
jgi:hypothetical protein